MPVGCRPGIVRPAALPLSPAPDHDSESEPGIDDHHHHRILLSLSDFGGVTAPHHLQVAQVILKIIEEYWIWLVILMNIDTY